ncbi:EamA family transporter RarD [Croceibacterium xixiisoli]
MLDTICKGGLGHALAAHAVWGSMPLYLLLVHDVPPLEFVAWRILVSVPLCLALITLTGRWAELRQVLADGRAMLVLLVTSAMIAGNWFLYVWAIQTGHVFAASLGYYILPLMMMLFGMAFLGERLRPRQWIAVGLAAIGVTVLASGALTTLWVSLAMALSFGIYGLLRKKVAAGPLAGLTVETLLLMLPSALVVGWFATQADGSVMGRDAVETGAIILGGPMTALPLLLFATAVRRMPYTVLGFLQFISPTVVFLLGLFVFHEPLRPAQLACFVAIWAAAALFCWDMLANARTRTVG